MREANETLGTTAHVGATGEADRGSSGDTGGSRRGLVATVGAVGAAFLASLCCIGPLVFVFFGVGAGLASTFEPLRPVFTTATVALLALGFYTVYGRRPATSSVAGSGSSCDLDANCRRPRRRRDQVLLWIATALAIVLLTFPQWSKLLV